MKLEELKKMIKEEFDSFVAAEAEETDVDVDVDSDEVAAEKNPEETLRSMFDMLKDYFEGEEEMGGEEMGDEEATDVEEDMMDEEADLEENSTTASQYQKTGFAAGGKSSSGANVGYGNPGGKGGTGFDAKSIALQERLQKLANIIK